MSLRTSSPPRRRRAPFAALAATAALTAALVGCTTAPLSFINDNQVYYRTVLNRYPVSVVAIDGRSTAIRPLTVAPGPHLLTLDAAPVAGFTLPVQKQYPLDVAPCTRYYVAAQRRGPLTQDWEFVVEDTWPVAGCDPTTELQKARTATSGGPPPAASSVIVGGAPADPRADAGEPRR